MRILINPDIFYTDHSGAVAARSAAKLLIEMGHEVGVFTHDEPKKLDFAFVTFTRKKYSSKAHFYPKQWKELFIQAVESFKPDYIFFIGGIINTPTVYLSEARERNIKTVFLLLVQDFYCARMHAALGNDSCNRCLIGSNINALLSNCLEKGSNKYLYYLGYQLKQTLFLPELKKLTKVLGSTDEQLEFYKRIGINPERFMKIPLFFEPSRIASEIFSNKDYFVFIAQNRPEKGIHLLPHILNSIEKDIIIKSLFYSQQEVDRFLLDYPQVSKFIENGQLELMPNITMQTGAVEIISESRGVLNLSIWATTTEFVFLEILGLKKPIIAFDVGVHKETIIHRDNGCLIAAGDFISFARELRFLSDNPKQAAKIGENGYDLYKKLTSAKMFKNKLKHIFE